MEQTGMFLCRMYYSGNLKPSINYEEGSGLWHLSRCVENVLEDTKGKRERSSYAWRTLMNGDLAKLNTRKRASVLGGWAQFPGIQSIDGADDVTSCEMALYLAVGMEFMKLCGYKGERERESENKQNQEV